MYHHTVMILFSCTICPCENMGKICYWKHIKKIWKERKAKALNEVKEKHNLLLATKRNEVDKRGCPHINKEIR